MFMALLYNLVYVSTRATTCTTPELKSILSSSRQRNASQAITGVLLYSDNRFLQYLEGDKDTIMALYRQIEKDKRHYYVTMLYHVPIEERIFPSWQMAYRDLDADPVKFLTEGGASERQVFRQLLEQDAYDTVEGVHVLKLFFERA